MKLATLALGGMLALALLTGCDHNGGGGDDGTPMGTETSVGDLATRQITTKTCDQASPDAINDLTIVDSDAAIDVATLTPGCNSGS